MLVTLLLFFMPTAVSALPTGYQEYYVLGYEEHIWQAFLNIYGGPVPPQICSTVSLVATADRQVIYYDHWEDGYEANLFNPVQSTTKIYGDGNVGNGGTEDDILFAGDDINLVSDQPITGPTAINGYVPVSPARDPTYIRYDGGDRIISSGGPVDLTHAMWPLDNSWIGGAWEVYSRQAYADAYSYRLPIGEDLYGFGGGDEGLYGDFRNVYLQLAAFEDNTTVSIDNGTDIVNVTLDRGETYSSMGYINSSLTPSITIKSGTTIYSDKPTQVGLVTGADSEGGDGFQGRFLIVLSDLLWGADYVVPVPSGGVGDQAEIYLSNPNDFPITVNAYDAATQTSFVISPAAYISSTVPYSSKRGGLGHVPQDSAARFTSSDGVFGVVVTADTSDIFYDWGFAGIPAKYLTRDYYVSWAPGSFRTPPTENGSPVWVTPLADGTTFYVDFSPLDGITDETFTLDVLQQRRVFDPDNDNTGMHIWATSEFAMAWGEDSRTAGETSPYLDMGLTTLPLLQRWLDPVLMLDKTADPTILPPAGGTVTFTLVVQGYNSPLSNVDLTDTLPVNWTYVPSSTHVTYPDDSAGNPEPSLNGQSLFWDLSTALDVNQSLNLTFRAQITNTGGAGFAAYDGFESATYNGGANWVNDWQEGDDDGRPDAGDVLITDLAPFAGDYSLRLVRSNNSISRMVDLSNFVMPTLHFMRQIDQLEDGDYFYLDIYDEGNWTTVLTWTVGGLEGSYVHEIVDLAPYASAATAIRFRSGSSVGNQAYFHTDQIEVYDSIFASVNRGEAVGKDEYSTTLFNPTDEATVYISPLNLTNAVSRDQVEIGDTLVYTLSYANLSASTPMADVVVRDALPIQYVAFQSASAGGSYYPVSGMIVWTLGTLPPGASGSVTFTVKVNHFVEDGTIIKNVGHISSNQAQAGSNQVCTTVLAPRVELSKSGPTAATWGQVITYTLSYHNVGAAEATGVLISDTMPSFTVYVPDSLAINTGSGWVALSDAVDGDQGAYISPTLVVAPAVNAGTIAAGEGGQIRFNARVKVDPSLGALILNSAILDRDLAIPHRSNTVVTRISNLLLSKAAAQAVVAPGGIISYTLTYENVSQSADQANVYVLEPIPSYTRLMADTMYGGDWFEYSWNNGRTWQATVPITPATHVRWYDAQLSRGRQESVGFAVQVDTLLLPNTIIRNMGRITSTEIAINRGGWIPSDQVQVETVDLWVEKRASQLTAQAGGQISYTIYHGNHGSADAWGVQIVDSLPSGTMYQAGSIWGEGAHVISDSLLSWNVMTVTAGASGQAVGYAAVLASELLPGAIITNTATLSHACQVVASDPVTVVITMPKISTNPAALTATLGVGDTTTRTLAVGNEGNVDLTWSLAENPAAPWLDESLSSGVVAPWDSDNVIVTFDATGSVAGIYTTTLQINSNDPQEPQVNVPVTLTIGSILSLDKVASADPVAPGERFTYTLRIVNDGLAAHGLIVSDVIPADTVFADCGGAACTLNDGQVIWGPLDRPGMGQVLSLTLSVTVNQGLSNGWPIVNADYWLMAEDVPLLRGPPVTTTVNMPTLSLTKWASQNEVYTGSRLRYTLQVGNAGGRASRLVVSDTLPDHTAFGGCDCTTASSSSSHENGPRRASFTCGLEGDEVVWRVDEMAGSHSLQMTFWVTVDDELAEGTLIVNDHYTVVADHLSPLVGSPPVTTTVRRLLVSVSKVAWPNPVTVGQQLVFTITLQNDGSLLRNVTVTDLLPGGVSFTNCGGALCELIAGDEPVVRWWLSTLPTASEQHLTVRTTVTGVQSSRIVNQFYGAWIPAAGRQVTGEAVEVRVLVYPVYLPLTLSNGMP